MVYLIYFFQSFARSHQSCAVNIAGGLEFEQSLFILGPSSKTRLTEGARREQHEKRETLFYLLGLHAPVSCVSLDARACSHSNPPAVFTARRLARPSKRLKEIDQIDHFCTRKALTLKKRGRVQDPICQNEFHLLEN